MSENSSDSKPNEEAPFSKEEVSEKQENLLLNILLNVALPAIILSKMSGEARLGPFWALIVAIALPIGYGLYDFIQRRNFNLFSAMGFVGVLLTGGLGLMKAGPQIFAIKEAVMPLLFGSFILLSHLKKEPLIKQMLLNPQLFAMKKINRVLDEGNLRAPFEALLLRCSVFLCITLAGSAVGNYFLAMHVLEGTEGGSTEYMEGIGKLTWMGYLIIGIPMTGAMVGIFFYLLKQLTLLTGLDSEELTNPGETVTKQVKKGEGTAPKAVDE